MFGCEDSTTPAPEQADVLDDEPDLTLPSPLDAEAMVEGGAFGAPCQDGSECRSGLCVCGPTGELVCTQTCASADPTSCPDPYRCLFITNSGADGTFLCAVETCPEREEADTGVDAAGPDASMAEPDAEVDAACVPTNPGGGDPSCDGVDDDCDGTVDEDFRDDACGVGACAATASPGQCVDGQVSPCVPGEPARDDATCDGVDDDCNGTADEDFRDDECGVGACADSAVPGQCADGEATPCQPGEPAAEDASCDGADDDCDGTADEDFRDDECGVGACAGSATAGQCVDGEATPCEPGEPAADDANCDGVDDDCDGTADEGFRDDDCGVGACAGSATPGQCVDGEASPCVPGAPSGDDATCDGVDDDCDGTADEGFRDDDCGVGACAASATPGRCIDGEASPCVPGAPADGDATCDGIDDDCDGAADEDYRDDECGVGACAAAATPGRCADGEATPCVPGEPAVGDSSCDGVDDDCDGSSDEDYRDDVCGVGACAATATPGRCAEGVSTPCTPGEPAADDATCDGVDDDCDGSIDEDFRDDACGVGACLASATPGRCVDGEATPCAPGEPAESDATCDGVDDDCDGTADEDFRDDVCGVGACAVSAAPGQCVDGVASPCRPGEPAVDDATCDGSDDDCDGAVDEDYRDDACGVGACAEAATPGRCVAGEAIPCAPGEPAAEDSTCDDVDDDCDGAADEDFRDDACGVGACAASATPGRCIDGEARPCSPGEPAGDDATCDGADDDCDGSTDEAFRAEGCGVGACATTATPSACVDGVITPCAPGAPAETDAGCDGVDEDCDGVIDEDYEPELCGLGPCAAESRCVDGVVEPCEAGDPQIELCNGVDVGDHPKARLFGELGARS